MKLIVNGRPVQVSGRTLRDVLGEVPEGHAVALNGEVVPRSRHTELVLADGDVLDVVTAVAGG